MHALMEEREDGPEPALTDADRARYLRRLRFPPRMEAAYRADNYQRLLPGLRAGLCLMALILLGQGIGWQIQSRESSPALVVLRPLAPLMMLGLTFWRGLWPYWEAVFAVTLAAGLPFVAPLVGEGLSESQFWAPAPARLAYLGMLTLWGVIMLFGMLPLRFGWAAVCQVMLGAWSLHTALRHVPLPAVNTLMMYGYVVYRR